MAKFFTKQAQVGYGEFLFDATGGAVEIPAEHVHAFKDMITCRWLVPVEGVAEAAATVAVPKPDFTVDPVAPAPPADPVVAAAVTKVNEDAAKAAKKAAAAVAKDNEQK